MSEIDSTYRISRFACQRCGCCCKGEGVVNVRDDETASIAEALGVSPEDFLARYTTLTEWGERWLNDKFVLGERWCVFLERDPLGSYGCAIQRAKPAQCLGFPYRWRPPDAFEWCAGLKASE